MFTWQMTRAVIVPIYFVAMGGLTGATAQARLPPPTLAARKAADVIRSPNGAFIVATVQQARTQLDLARLALAKTSARDTRNLALQAQDLWQNVDRRLRDIAQALGIPMPAQRDASASDELSRLQNAKASDFDLIYARLVTRSCDALLERMDRMDPRINSRLLFFVDEMLPRFGQLQMGMRERYAYEQADPIFLAGAASAQR